MASCSSAHILQYHYRGWQCCRVILGCPDTAHLVFQTEVGRRRHLVDGQHEQNRLSALGIQVSHALPYHSCESPRPITQIKLRPCGKPYQRERKQSRKTPCAPHRMLHWAWWPRRHLSRSPRCQRAGSLDERPTFDDLNGRASPALGSLPRADRAVHYLSGPAS